LPPHTTRRAIAIEAAGNLVAAYVILIAACIVGVGDYTSTLRFTVLTGTVNAIALILIIRITLFITTRLKELADRGAEKGHRRWRLATALPRDTRNMLKLMLFVILLMTTIELVLLPVAFWFKELTGYTGEIGF
jgi:hypothetical protein